MLTGDLVRATVRGGRVVPGLIDVRRAELLDVAEALIEAVAGAAEHRWTRGELDEAIEERIGSERQVKVLRGLAKLLLDRCEVEVDAPVPPAELRARVFRRARERRPLALERDALGRPTAEDVLAEVGAELGLDVEAAGRALYGDLHQAQVVARFRPIDAPALLRRYNVALVQAVLLKAYEVRVWLQQPTVPRLRQLLRFVKFHQLMHRAEREDDAVKLVLDGPGALFAQSTRYGGQLARFLPAVLLQEPPWRLEADVTWGASREQRLLEVTPALGLVSHLADTGAYEARERQWFRERWEAAAADLPWRMSEETLPIELGGRGVILPDFTFTDGRRTAHLEIVGFWRKEWLQRRLEGLRRHGPGNLVLAVSRKLAAEKAALDDAPGEVVSFSEVVPVKQVVEALDRVAR